MVYIRALYLPTSYSLCWYMNIMQTFFSKHTIFTYVLISHVIPSYFCSTIINTAVEFDILLLFMYTLNRI